MQMGTDDPDGIPMLAVGSETVPGLALQYVRCYDLVWGFQWSNRALHNGAGELQSWRSIAITQARCGW